MDKTLYTQHQQQFQELLREVRKEARLRQQDLAAAIDEPQSFVSKYESGQRRLDILELRTICAAIGLTLPEFVNRLEAKLARSRSPAKIPALQRRAPARTGHTKKSRPR